MNKTIYAAAALLATSAAVAVAVALVIRLARK